MTTKITTFNRATCRLFSQELAAHLEDFCRERGLTLLLKGGRFSELEFRLPIEFTVIANAEGKSARQVAFERDCALYHLTPADFERRFVVQGIEYLLVGLDINRPKRPVLATQTKNGKTYLFRPDVLKLLREKEETK